MGLKRYIVSRLLTYLAVFIVAVSLIWLLIRVAPGDPITTALAQLIAPYGGQVSLDPAVIEAKRRALASELGLDLPYHLQYLRFWQQLFTGNLGYSTFFQGKPVIDIISTRIVYDLILMIPAVLLSWLLGNWLGAMAARSKSLDRVMIPIMYILSATPYFMLALVLQYLLTVQTPMFPTTFTEDYFKNLFQKPSLETLTSFLHAYTLPFLSVTIVSLGGWASGMRTLMIYELESNYSRYMEALGFSRGKITWYAFRHAINPQITGLGISLGTIIIGAVTISVVFNYPGLGLALIQAINMRDVFLVQGIAIVYTLMVVASNFIIDVLYAVLDPRIRIGVTGG